MTKRFHYTVKPFMFGEVAETAELTGCKYRLSITLVQSKVQGTKIISGAKLLNLNCRVLQYN